VPKHSCGAVEGTRLGDVTNGTGGRSDPALDACAGVCADFYIWGGGVEGRNSNSTARGRVYTPHGTRRELQERLLSPPAPGL